MFEVAFGKDAEKEFLQLDKQVQKIIASKIIDLKDGLFTNDKQLKGKHKGKFRKRAGSYRIIYLKENNLLVILVIRIAHRIEVY